MAEGPWSDRDITAYVAEKTFCLAFPVREWGMFRFTGLVPEEFRGRDDLGFDILDSYEAERIPFARSLVATTDRVFEAVVGRSLFSRFVRGVFAPFILPLALKFAAARRTQFRLVS